MSSARVERLTVYAAWGLIALGGILRLLLKRILALALFQSQTISSDIEINNRKTGSGCAAPPFFSISWRKRAAS